MPKQNVPPPPPPQKKKKKKKSEIYHKCTVAEVNKTGIIISRNYTNIQSNMGKCVQYVPWRTTMSPLYFKNLPWWRHQMETFSALLAVCAGNTPVTGEFSIQRPVTRIFHIFFDLRLNKRLSKQSGGRWFETLSRPLWRHFNACHNCCTHFGFYSPNFDVFRNKIKNRTAYFTYWEFSSSYDPSIMEISKVDLKAKSHISIMHLDDLLTIRYIASADIVAHFSRNIPDSRDKG